MSDLNIVPNNALVVVADGEGARMFRAVRAGESFHLKESEPVEPQNLDDDGPAGARPPEQDKQQTDEATFAKQLANRLYKMAHAREFDALYLIADPQTLGQMRGSLHAEVTNLTKRQIPKTLTNSSVEAIAAQLG